MNMRQRPSASMGRRSAEAPGTSMTTSTAHDGNTTVLVVSGEVDISAAPRLTAELGRCLAQQPETLGRVSKA